VSVIPIPSDSVDAFIARQLADWLKGANVDLLLTLHRALRHQQAAAENVKHALAGIPSLEAFATPRLEQALRDRGLAEVNVRTMKVFIELDVPMPSAAPRLHTPWRTLHSVQPLLTAALHNFHESETSPSLHRRAYLQDADKVRLPMAFEAFAQCCRTLDIGGQYQQLLRAQLFPKSRPTAPKDFARVAVERMLEESLRAKLDVAVRMARIKSELDEGDYLRLLSVIASKPIVPAVPGIVTPRQLFLLGKRIHGLVTLELRESAEGPLEGIICWVPQDPHRPVAKHASWDALYLSLAKKLRAPHYRSFFSRFISERDRVTFTATLERLIEASSVRAPAVLDGRNLAVETPLFAYLRGLQVDKMLDDASILAVPTADETAIERHQRLEALKSAGLDALNLAALFIPVLGEVMFAVAAVDVVSEVYKGYADWQIGDRQGALDHLFGVAENVAVGALVGVGVAGVGRVLERVPFVDALTPLHEGEGRSRLRPGRSRPITWMAAARCCADLAGTSRKLPTRPPKRFFVLPGSNTINCAICICKSCEPLHGCSMPTHAMSAMHSPLSCVALRSNGSWLLGKAHPLLLGPYCSGHSQACPCVVPRSSSSGQTASKSRYCWPVAVCHWPWPRVPAGSCGKAGWTVL